MNTLAIKNIHWWNKIENKKSLQKLKVGNLSSKGSDLCNTSFHATKDEFCSDSCNVSFNNSRFQEVSDTYNDVPPTCPISGFKPTTNLNLLVKERLTHDQLCQLANVLHRLAVPIILFLTSNSIQTEHKTNEWFQELLTHYCKNLWV